LCVGINAPVYVRMHTCPHANWPLCLCTVDEIIRLDLGDYSSRIVGTTPVLMGASGVAFVPGRPEEALIFGGMSYVGLYPSDEVFRWRWALDEAQQADFDPEEEYELINAYYKGACGGIAHWLCAVVRAGSRAMHAILNISLRLWWLVVGVSVVDAVRAAIQREQPLGRLTGLKPKVGTHRTKSPNSSLTTPTSCPSYVLTLT
jgi:hypothetical protein